MDYFNRIILRGLTFLLLLTFISCEKNYLTITFDSENEVSGMKFPLKEVSPGLPENWEDYEFVILEFMITTPQRFRVGFNTDHGYNELRIMSYTPNGWNRLSRSSKG